MSAPIVKKLSELTKYAIAPGDTVKQVYLTGPEDGVSASVFYEVWDPEGTQPDNSHADSVEVFLILSGSGVAYSDEHQIEIGAGDIVVLPKGSVHRIVNTSPNERMYAVTVMANDLGSMEGGFAALVTSGQPEQIDAVDVSTILSTPVPLW